jgi:hypothetical protein
MSGRVNVPILRELRGVLCQCGGKKLRDQTFCRTCYGRLPRTLQLPLWKRLGDGYEQAYTAALEFLRRPV